MGNNTDLDALVPWQKGPTERGGYGIIFSCLAVVITSTWTVLHLNLPGTESPVPIRIWGWTLIEISWTTLRKMKWMLIMIIFPELVFAHAVLELRMALDDYILMDEQHEAMYRKGWCVWAGSWTFILHDVLSGRWPALQSSVSSSWPWLKTVSARKCEHHKQTTARQSEDEHDETGMSEITTNGGTALEPITAGVPAPYHQGDDVRSQLSEALLGEDASVAQDDIWPNFRRCEDTTQHAEQHVVECEWNYNEYRAWNDNDKSLIWTLTHVYFANMGGIRSNYHMMSASYLARSLNLSPVDYGFNRGHGGLMTVVRLSEDVILDKSKADTLVRLLWILQILRLWFEVLARTAAHLAVTQLEIITLSFSVLSATIYVVQWKKPKDVETPIKFNDERIWDIQGIPEIQNHARTLSSYISPARPPGWPTRVLNDVFREEHEGLFMIMLAISTVLFGLIHCGAWNYQFPSAEERWIWRSCAVFGVLLPLAVTLLTLPLSRKIRRFETEISSMKATFRSVMAEIENGIQGSLDLDRLESRFAPIKVPVFTNLLRVFREALRNCGEEGNWSAQLSNLEFTANQHDGLESKRRKLMSRRRFYQHLPIAIYLATRLIIIVIAFTSFRSAPRGIYKDTWAIFIPTFQ